MERSPGSRSDALRLYAAPAIVLVIAILCATAAALYVRKVVHAQQEARFDAEATAAGELLRDRMRTYTAMLRAGRGLFETLREEPDAGTFARFVESLDISRHYPGIQGIGFAKAIRPHERALHEQRMREQGRAGYRIWPEGDRALYSSIVYIEPLDWRNQRAIGYDMFSEPTRREAMERARDTGDVAASAKVELVQEAGAQRQAGFLMYLPVYGRTPETDAERRRFLVGWVYAPFRATDLVERTFDSRGGSLDIRVYDGVEERAEALLHDDGRAPEPGARTRLERIEVAGRPWTVRYTATGAFASRTERGLPWGVLVAGLAVAGLLFGISRGVTLARARAERSARRSSFLAEAGTILSAATETEQTLPDVATLAASTVADACVLLLLDPAGACWFTGHRNPVLARRAAELLLGASPGDGAALGVGAALATGETLVRDRIDVRGLREQERAGAKVLRELSARAALTVPLHARGQSLGAVVLLASGRGARFGEDDVRLAEHLARLIASAVETSRLYRRAQEAVAARDEFLSIASHELKTPLTSLVLHTDSLRAAARRGTLGQAAPKVELIRRSVDRLSRLVSSLLDISRISAGRLEVELEELDLVEVAREVVARFEDEAVRAGCTLLLQAEPVKGRWDRLRLDQVITNLLSNAVKYGRGKPVVVRVEPAGDRAILSVRDHGIGISQPDQRRIFQRFERAVSKRNYGGFGLGLWIVRQIVEALGGTVHVESAPGEGSMFTVDLARGLPAPAHAAEPHARSSLPPP